MVAYKIDGFTKFPSSNFLATRVEPPAAIDLPCLKLNSWGHRNLCLTRHSGFEEKWV